MQIQHCDEERLREFRLDPGLMWLQGDGIWKKNNTVRNTLTTPHAHIRLDIYNRLKARRWDLEQTTLFENTTQKTPLLWTHHKPGLVITIVSKPISSLVGRRGQIFALFLRLPYNPPAAQHVTQSAVLSRFNRCKNTKENALYTIVLVSQAKQKPK